MNKSRFLAGFWRHFDSMSRIVKCSGRQLAHTAIFWKWRTKNRPLSSVPPAALNLLELSTGGFTGGRKTDPPGPTLPERKLDFGRFLVTFFARGNRLPVISGQNQIS